MDKPATQHEWLQQLVGEWDVTSVAVMGPDLSTVTTKSKETVRSLGGMWILCEGKGEHVAMPDGHQYLLTIGYDLKKAKYVASFVSNGMSAMWTYEGTLEGNILSLSCKGPSWNDPNKLVDYVDELELVSPDHKRQTSKCFEDGKSVVFNTHDYHRIK